MLPIRYENKPILFLQIIMLSKKRLVFFLTLTINV